MQRQATPVQRAIALVLHAVPDEVMVDDNAVLAALAPVQATEHWRPGALDPDVDVAAQQALPASALALCRRAATAGTAGGMRPVTLLRMPHPRRVIYGVVVEQQPG